MVWIIIGAVIIAVLGYFEWRSRDKPLGPGFANAHEAAHNTGRPEGGGHDMPVRPRDP